MTVPPAQQVSCLVCHAHIPIALACLPTLLRYSQNPVELILHDDGSLTDCDATQLIQALPGSRIIRRQEADQRMADELKNRPASAAYRRASCMGLKLFDSVYFTAGQTYAYTDSDILFIRPFRDLFQFPDDRTHAIFIHDTVDNCYSFRSWQLLLAPGIKLPQRVNAGLSCFRRSHYDPDFLEWFLAHPARRATRHHLWFTEQTAWAALGMRVGMKFWNPANVTIAHPNLQVTPSLIAAHFVGLHRQLLPQYQARCSPNGSPISASTVPAKRCTSLHLAVGETRRVLERLTTRIFT